MGIYTELTQELLQKLEEETEVLWIGGSKPTDTFWDKKFLIFRASRYELSCSDGPAIKRNKHEYVHQTKFLSICKEKLPKHIKDEIKVGDWICTKRAMLREIFQVKHIDAEGDYWDRNPDDIGSKVICIAIKLHPYKSGEAKVGDNCVTLVDLDPSLPSLTKGQIVTVKESYPGVDGAEYIRLKEDPDHQGWSYYQLAPLPKINQEKVEEPKETKREKVPPYQMSCPKPEWLGKWATHSQVRSVRWEGRNWVNSAGVPYDDRFLDSVITTWTKIEPGIDECPQVQPPKERYHIKYPLLAGILD